MLLEILLDRLLQGEKCQTPSKEKIKRAHSRGLLKALSMEILMVSRMVTLMDPMKVRKKAHLMAIVMVLLME